MLTEWWQEIKSNFWYDLDDLMWTLIYAGGLLMLFFEITNRLRG